MSNKNLKKLVKKYRRELAWKVEEIRGADVADLEIKSYKRKRLHRIFIPDANIRDIEILHEIGHAILCENVHMAFSTLFFQAHIDKRVVDQLVEVCRYANDWFVDHWLFNIVPEEEKAEVEEHYLFVSKAAGNDEGILQTLDGIMALSFISAQAIKYCGRKVVRDGQSGKLVEAFLSVNPDNPTLGKLEKLINLILSALESDVTLKYSDVQSCWILQVKGEKK